MPATYTYEVKFTLHTTLAPHDAEQWANELADDARAHLLANQGERLALTSVELVRAQPASA